MMTMLLSVLVVAVLLAVVTRLRLWYYERRYCQQIDAELATEARCHALRDQCGRIWWEGQR